MRAPLVLILALCALVGPVSRGHAQHTHEGDVGRFYQSWMMPTNRTISCCHDQDCQPAASRLVDGKWQAERDGEWVTIPPERVEHERDSPDGRSHLCGKKYSAFGQGGFTTFCFIPGGGA